MKRIATALRLSLAVVALSAWAGTALAQATAEPLGTFAGYTVHNHVMGTTHLQSTAPNAIPVVVYDNTLSAANFGISSTDLTAYWGDQLATTGTGTLQEMALTLFNAASSAGPLLTANVGVEFYDANTITYLGGFSANFNFGAGLGVGFYTIGTITGLDPLMIDITTTDVIVLQTVVSKTGTASRLGIASMNPPTVGSSPATMYIDALTVGAPGWYTIASGPANPGYMLSLITTPVSTDKSSWGRLKNLYR